MSRPEAEFRVRDGFVLAAAVIALGAVALVTLGTWKWFVRRTAPAVLDWPGGSWAFGAVCGLLVVFGSTGVWRFSEKPPRESRPGRALRVAGLAVSGGGAFGSVMYVLASLPGRNCSSYEDGCEYVPGTGSALVACLGTAAVVGYAAYRVRSVRGERRGALERERLRRLRKKGKGKSRGARLR
ncbi:hypothetical protein [Streptomyces sp. NBC_00140]|uniref:hypothetical protein n=1 Tax=Streptomyces sp. NBC_00140 TaxID=2975664 RepID=UPI00224DD6F6|nr:hypothetical protein [Streptomyces sp. NBC_00140]MCX5332248.1 hypothetical protein [Streptomyces sp. NBC_00140]